MARDLTTRPDVEDWVNSSKNIKFIPSEKRNILLEYKGQEDTAILRSANQIKGLISTYYLRNRLMIVFYPTIAKKSPLDEVKKVVKKVNSIDSEPPKEVAKNNQPKHKDDLIFDFLEGEL